MSAWDGVDLAVVRDAAQGDLLNEPILITVCDTFGGGKAVYVEKETRTANGRKKSVRVLPGPLLADSHADLLRLLADVLDGKIISLSVTS